MLATHTAIIGPEVGVLGLALSVVVATGPWQWHRRTKGTDHARV